MKQIFVTAFLITLSTGFSASASVLRGPSTSGGGMAVVCREVSGNIRYAELLDLYEARTVHYLTLLPATGSIEQDYFNGVYNTYRLQGNPALANQERANINENLRRFFDIAQMTAPGQKLDLLNDAGKVPSLVAGCQLEQLAIFHDTTPESVEVNSEIWNSLDSLSRAALVSHEQMYKWDRILASKTSENSRNFVAHIYASSGVTPVNDGVPSSATKCSAKDPRFDEVTHRDGGSVSTSNNRLSSFTAYPVMTPNGPGTRLQFNQIAGEPIITKTTVEIPGAAWKLKRIYDTKLEDMVLIVDEPNKNIVMEIATRGDLKQNRTILVQYKTGEPVLIIPVEKRFALTSQIVTSCY